MLRLTAIFVAVCVVLIAASLGAVVYLVLGLSVAESTTVALAALTALSLYNMVSSRVRDRSDIGDQIADLSRGTADLARQVGEFGRRMAVIENDVKNSGRQVSADMLTAEIGDLSMLIKQLAETVAAHETALATGGLNILGMPPPALPAAAIPVPGTAATETAAPALENPTPRIDTANSGPFKDKTAEDIVRVIGSAIDNSRVDLYLQPVVTLPQRKVRYYEGMTRLRTEDGDLILPADFISHAEKSGLMPKIDNLQLFRCVQVLRRLLVKNREIGLFCNISITTLQDAVSFTQFLQFMEANRALASSLILEFTQAAIAAFGPIENECVAALAERGFRFSMDMVTNLRMEPRQLAEQGIRFVKIPATLLLNRTPASADIHVADLSDLLGRYGISLIAERIETEAAVVDLLDYDVRFGQGFLFSPPRPVRAEALQGMADRPESATREMPAGASGLAPARPQSLTPSSDAPPHNAPLAGYSRA